jgi:pimeloyl-ACP methyl ester carboxylesterase
MIDVGTGAPLVLVPGVQGRWEWMAPAVDALSRHCRVVSYSLAGDPGSGKRLRASDRFDVLVEQLDEVFDRAGLDRAALCGVSLGGWIAARYAARRPDRVQSLVLVSAPGPTFKPNRQQALYIQAPWLLFPLFLVTSRGRMQAEIFSVFPTWAERWQFTRAQLKRLAFAPLSPGLMARRVRLALQEDFSGDCERIAAPTLVITGEHGLDRIVPHDSTLDYLKRVRGSTAAVLPQTGHLGLVTRPREWADLVMAFVNRHAETA